MCEVFHFEQKLLFLLVICVKIVFFLLLNQSIFVNLKIFILKLNFQNIFFTLS